MELTGPKNTFQDVEAPQNRRLGPTLAVPAYTEPRVFFDLEYELIVQSIFYLVVKGPSYNVHEVMDRLSGV